MSGVIKNIHWLIGQIIKDIFRVSLITLIIFFVLDNFEPGLISNHLSFNSMIIFTLIAAILTAVWYKEEEIAEEDNGDRQSKDKKIGRAYFQGFIFGLIAMILIGWQTISFGLFGYLLSILACLVIVIIFGVMKSG